MLRHTMVSNLGSTQRKNMAATLHTFDSRSQIESSSSFNASSRNIRVKETVPLGWSSPRKIDEPIIYGDDREQLDKNLQVPGHTRKTFKP
jgi:hypothetical protein